MIILTTSRLAAWVVVVMWCSEWNWNEMLPFVASPFDSFACCCLHFPFHLIGFLWTGFIFLMYNVQPKWNIFPIILIVIVRSCRQTVSITRRQNWRDSFIINNTNNKNKPVFYTDNLLLPSSHFHENWMAEGHYWQKWRKYWDKAKSVDIFQSAMPTWLVTIWLGCWILSLFSEIKKTKRESEERESNDKLQIKMESFFAFVILLSSSVAHYFKCKRSLQFICTLGETHSTQHTGK